MKHTHHIFSVMALVSLLSILFSAKVVAQTAALGLNDIITVSYSVNGHIYYVSRVPNSTQIEAVVDNPTVNCLWVISKETGSSSAANNQMNNLVVQVRSWSAIQQGGTAASNSYMNMPATNGGTLRLGGSASASNLYTIKSSQVVGSYVQANVLVKGGRDNFYLRYENSWQSKKNAPQTMRVQKWGEASESDYHTTFSPTSLVFGYAANAAAADAQAVNVTCQIAKHESHYFYNVANPQERIRVQEPTITLADASSATFAWKTPGETQMTFTTPSYNSSTKTWSFSVKPVGASPMMEEDAVTAMNPFKDIENDLVCHATLSGQSVSAEIDCIRRKYMHRRLPHLDFTVTHPSYRFPQAGGTLTLTPYLYVQDKQEWVNTDGLVEYSLVTQLPDRQGGMTDRYRVQYPDFGLDVTVTNNADWLTPEDLQPLGIPFTATANTSNVERSTTIMVSVQYAYYEWDNLTNDYKKDGLGRMFPPVYTDHFIRQITLSQAGQMEGAAVQFVHKPGRDMIAAGKPGAGEQAVHTNKKVLYYIPGDGSDYGSEVELTLAEKAFYAYRRWYNFDNGRGIQNSATDADNTIWASSPQIVSGGTNYNFTPINTDPVNSRGLFVIRRSDGVSRGFRVMHKDQSEPAPIVRGYKTATGGPKHDGVHTIACDLSCYMDYAITESAGKLTGLTEPTLSYRMLFELHPATEIADKIEALAADEYLENYEITAPTGVDVFLSTSQRFRTYSHHESEFGYFYYNGSHELTRLQSGKDGKEIWFREGTSRINSPRYSPGTDNIIVSKSTPGDVVYTLKLGNGSASDLRIAKFTVHYVNPLTCGPSSVALLTNKEISDRYQVLAKIDWDDVDTKPGERDNVLANYHLPWEDATYGYAYHTAPFDGENKNYYRPTSTLFCQYGEYLLVNKWTTQGYYYWIDQSIENHTGKANGYMLYADGTMEPGLVATIKTSATICSGQHMYCSAWIANACPTDYAGANPIFRFSVQGRNSDSEEWQDVEVFFSGELPKSSGWRQIMFPINSNHSYSQTRVCIYNFATTNAGNDFFIDDIYLFATPLPISAYQATSACSGEDVVVVVKVDYQNVADDLHEKEVYYQGWIETIVDGDTTATAIPDLNAFAGGYYLWHDGGASYAIKSKYEADHPSSGLHTQDAGRLYIPSRTFVPADEDIYRSVQDYIDHLHAQTPGTRESRSGVFYVLEADGKYAMFLVHLLHAHDGGNYEVRFAEEMDELPSPLCSMKVKFPIYKQTELTWGDDSQPISTPVENVCPNINSEIKVTVTNAHIASHEGGEVRMAEGRADWLIGIAADSIFGKAYVDRDVTPLPDGKKYVKLGSTIAAEKVLADTAFRRYYGYTREQVTTAFVYDLRRLPYVNHPNANYDVSDYTQLDKSAFLEPLNYDIVVSLCRRGLVDMNISKRTVALSPGDSLFLWVYPIVGSAELDGQLLEVCNEPQWVDIRTSKLGDDKAEQIFNPSPIRNEDKTPAQKLMTPTVRVTASEVNTSFRVPVNNLQNAVLAWDSLRVIGTNDPALKAKVDAYTTAYDNWADHHGAYPNPRDFSMRYYADKVYQGTNGIEYYLADGVTPNPDYHSDTKCATSGSHTWSYYQPGDYITFRPIDNEYVLYLVDRSDKSEVVDGTGHYSIYSSSDANWVTKTSNEGTGPQPGFQHSNTPDAVMKPNYTYNMMTNLVTLSFGGELGGAVDQNGCRYATTYFDVIVVPELLIWRPTVNNDWGNDANWHGVVNGREMEWGFAPLSTTSVIIPQMENDLLYPVVTGENLYPMSSGYQPAACDNIYMEAGAHILGQEKLQYNKAFVDMPVAHSKWQLMASPMRKMYSGDFFVPQNVNDWSGNTLEAKPYGTDVHGTINSLLAGHTGETANNGTLFYPSTFRGTRDNGNPYAFWISFYNREVNFYHNGTSKEETTVYLASDEFTSSNALDNVIMGGQGFSILGYGPWDEGLKKSIDLRLPKVDDSYQYFQYGNVTDYSQPMPRDADFTQFAWTSDGGQPSQMTITLHNGKAGTYFLMGNPSMAYIDLVEFMEDNKGVLTGSFRYMRDEDDWVAVSKEMLEVSGHRFLTPMEAIMVEARSPQSDISVVFDADQMTLDNMTHHAFNAPARTPVSDEVEPAPKRAAMAEDTDASLQLMTITAFNDDMEAVAYLGKKSTARQGYRAGEDVFFTSSGAEAGLQNDGSALTTPLNIYTVSDSNALMVDIRPGISLVPLRFLMHDDYRTDMINIIFNVNSDWTTQCYLIDSVAGTRTPILNGYVMSIQVPDNHQYRYYIEGPDPYIQDAPEQPDTPTATEKVVVSDEVFDPSVEKVIKDGHVYIRRGTTLYHVTGIRVE